MEGFEPSAPRFQGAYSDLTELHPENGAIGTVSNLRPADYKSAALPLSYDGASISRIRRVSFVWGVAVAVET